MQGRNYQPHPIALANVGRGVEVSAYEQRNAHGSRTQRRDSKLQAREDYVRPREGFGHVDDEFAIRCQSPQHGRGWVYFAGVIQPSMLLWLCVLAFLVGCITALMVEYGERTWALVQALG